MRVQRSRTRQRGAAAVEFALVAPVIILMIMGMLDFGLVMNAQAVVANAARDGARRASLGATYDLTRSTAWTSASALLNVASLSSATPNPTVTVQCYTDIATTTACPVVAGRTGATTDYDKGRAANSVVKVTVTYTYSYITPIPAWVGLGSRSTISKVSYMRIEVAP